MELSLTHQFVLLSVNENGGFNSDSFISMNFGMAGAILSELTLARYIEIVDEKVYATGKTTGILVYDDVLAMIIKEKKPRMLQTWVSRLAYRMGRIKKLALHELSVLGIVSVDHKSFLFIFKFKKYKLVNKQLRLDIQNSLRNILIDHQTPTIKQVLLISLISSCNMLNSIFPDRKERKLAKHNASDILEKKLNIPVETEKHKETKSEDISGNDDISKLSSLN